MMSKDECGMTLKDIPMHLTLKAGVNKLNKQLKSRQEVCVKKLTNEEQNPMTTHLHTQVSLSFLSAI